MIERRSGRIVALISMTAIRGIPFEAAYGASKAALQTFLESLRPAPAPPRHPGYAGLPGFVQTPLLEDLMQRGMARPPGVIDAGDSRPCDPRRRPSRRPDRQRSPGASRWSWS
jgi:NAD(P)-dependent dehydrogenase (short-subunit alcohol dehydrogenase family)